jgi:hypothetical protein
MKSSSILFQTIVYLSLPFIFFCLFFLQWYVALILLASLLSACLSIWRQYDNREDYGRLSCWQILLSIVMAIFVCLASGISGYLSQSYDWISKNPLLNDLTLSSWPLILDFSEATDDVQSLCGEGQVAFVYYLFYYLPAALIGKVFGSLMVARLTLFLWSVYGLTLVGCWLLLIVSQRVKLNYKKLFFVLAVFVLWGGSDIVGQGIQVLFSDNPNMSFFSWFDHWSLPYFMYHANFSSLYWCFNQCIPLWLIVLLILHFQDIRTIIFFFSFSLLYSPWGVMGLLPIVAVFILTEIGKKGQPAFREMVSFPNIGFPLLLQLVVGAYYLSNSTPIPEKGFFWEFWSVSDFLVAYIVFLLVELGIYVYLLRQEMRDDKILLSAVIVLAIIPLYKMNYANDFVLRASIPALYIVCVKWIQWSCTHFNEHRIAILCVFVLCSFSAIQQIYHNTYDTIIHGKSNTYCETERFSSGDNVKMSIFGESQFFAHDYEDTLFWKYVARKSF